MQQKEVLRSGMSLQVAERLAESCNGKQIVWAVNWSSRISQFDNLNILGQRWRLLLLSHRFTDYTILSPWITEVIFSQQIKYYLFQNFKNFNTKLPLSNHCLWFERLGCDALIHLIKPMGKAPDIASFPENFQCRMLK